MKAERWHASLAGLALCLSLLIVTCGSVQSPAQPWRPDGAVRVSPPAMWLANYAAAEQCLEAQGVVDSVTWWSVPGRSFADSGGVPVIGLWNPPHTIYIADDWKNFEWVVRHESIHDILQSGVHAMAVFGPLCHATWGHLP